MAHFVRVGKKFLNVAAIAVADREGHRLRVDMLGAGSSISFEGPDADRVEAEILRYQELNDEFLRRNRVVSAQNYQ